MRPPICDVCGARPTGDGVGSFATLRFADHEPLPDGMTGHPKGLQWLCGKHAAAAQELTTLPWPAALEVLRASSGWRRLVTPDPRGSDGHLQQVVEPLGVRRSTGAMFVLFAVAGVGAGIAVFSSGEWIFGILFTSMFVGIPWLIHRAAIGPGVPGFTLTSDGILGAAEQEHGLISWGEVDQLAWRSTGLTINDVPCLTLHAQLTDGRSIRVMTYTARRGREVEDIEAQVRGTGLLPERVSFGSGEAPRSSGRPATPTSDAVPGEPSSPPPTTRDWSDLPVGVKAMLILFILAFFFPFAIALVMVPIALFAVAGPFAWIGTAVLVAVATLMLMVGQQRLREPVLSCVFTVEGVVSEFGDGLTVPWREDMALRIDPGSSDGGSADGVAGAGQGWVVRLHRPEAPSIQLSKVLTSRRRVLRAVAELATAKRQSLIPADITLTLPPDFPPAPF